MVRKLGDMLRHMWLVKRMAKRAGVDLEHAYANGQLPAETWPEMVQTCRACQWTGGCGRHLNRAEDGAAVPAQCLNKKTLDALRSQAR